MKTMLNEELKIQCTQIKTKFFLSKLVTAIENVRPNFSGPGLTESFEGLQKLFSFEIRVVFSETLLFWGF